MLHIVHGNTEDGNDVWLKKAVKRKIQGNWIVPKSASIGDQVVINILGVGLFATAKIVTVPVLNKYRKNRYSALINNIRLIEPAISISSLELEIPEFRWTRYPKSHTTPEKKIANKIEKLILERKKTRLPRLSKSALSGANLEELRKVALVSANKKVPGKSAKTLYRIRSEAINRYVLKRSAGVCESCGSKAPFLKKDGSPYLEAHHTTRLADDGPDHPEKVIAVCPNCHRRAHYSRDSNTFNDSLKRKVLKIENNLKS